MKNYISNLVLILVSTIFALVVCELIVRIISPFDTFAKRYPLSINHNELSTSQPQKFDLELGYVYKAGFYHPSHPNFGGKIIATYKDGIRSNLSKDIDSFKKNNFSQPAYNAENAIVATGDSFVAGNEVGNSQTWPAILERVTKKRVLNGGVGGYSFTQAVLMGERLVNEKNIKHLIVSLIPEDLVRGEHSIYQGVPRPYYIKENNQLALYSGHIKNFRSFRRKDKEFMNNVLEKYSWSFLIMEIIKRTYTNPEVFYYFGLQKQGGVRFDEVGCNLVKRIDKFSKVKNVKTAVLIQYPDFYFYDKDNDGLDYINRYLYNFKACVRKSDLFLLDMKDSLNKIYRDDRNRFNRLYVGQHRHMSEEGNSFTADFIASSIKQAWGMSQ